jgi:cyanophycinase
MAIDQHVLVRNRQFDLIPVIENNPSNIGVAIDESTAIIVEAGKFKVWGLSYALLYDPLDWGKQQKEIGKVIKPFKMLGSGDGYDFNTRKILN